MDFATVRRLGRPLKWSLSALSRNGRFFSAKSPRWYRMKDGFWMELDPSQSVDREMVKRGGVWEPALRELIRSCARPGDVVMDIGAHKGWATCLMAQRVGQGGHVISVDPDPRAFAALSKNIMRNGFSQVSAHQVAVGQSNRTVKLSLTGTLGNTSVFPNYIAQPDVVQEIEVPCVTLDTLMSTFDMKGRDLPFIKIDAEGAEPLIWSGMREVLARHKPIVAMEINYASLEAGRLDLDEFKETLVEAGYVTCFQTIYEDPTRGGGTLQLQETDIGRRGELLIDVVTVPNAASRIKLIEKFIQR